MQRDKQLSCKHFATSALRVNYARERRIVCALQAAHELTREERDHYRLARIWRTSLAQSEVVKGETAAVALPPAAAVKARVLRFFRGASAELQQRPRRRSEMTAPLQRMVRDPRILSIRAFRKREAVASCFWTKSFTRSEQMRIRVPSKPALGES